MKIYCKSISYNETYELTRCFFPEQSFEQTFIPEEGDLLICEKDGDIAIFLEDGGKTRYCYYENVSPFRGTEKTVLHGSEGKDAFISALIHSTDTAENKHRIKGVLYDFLKDYTGKSLPWGTLTGVRPIKLFTERLLKGEDEKEVYANLKAKYRLSDDKAALAIFVAKKEYSIIMAQRKECVSVYISIPFCPSICSYCTFSSHATSGKETLLKAYLHYLHKEITQTGRFLREEGLVIDTIYIGGGTPGILSPEQIEELFTAIDTHMPTDEVREITFEAGRPDVMTAEKYRRLQEMGVTRISINPQTMHQKTLKRIGRTHRVEEIVENVLMAKSVGHFTLNMDLIAGLPGESIEDFRKTLREVNLFQPDNVTIHTLSLKRGAKVDKHTVTDKVIGQMHQLALKNQFKEGLSPYYLYRQKNSAGFLENIGFAKDGKECIYNILMIEEKQTIIGLGAGATGKIVTNDKVTTLFNPKDPYYYCDHFDEFLQDKLETITTLRKES